MRTRKKHYYHGTSADNLPAILRHGLKPVPSQQRLWNDSYPEHVYLWDDAATEGCGESNATDSGSYACLRARDKRIVVLQVAMPSDRCWEDLSGTGMADLGAVCTQGVARRYITGYSISEDISPAFGAVLASCTNMTNLRIALTPLEQRVADLWGTHCGQPVCELLWHWKSFRRQGRLWTPTDR